MRQAASDVAGNVTPMPALCSSQGGETSKEGVGSAFTRADAPARRAEQIKRKLESGSDPNGIVSIGGRMRQVGTRGTPNAD